jgi:fatty acid desaturase
MSSVLKFINFMLQKLRSLLDPNLNPLRHSPVLVRYFATILLACFWCLAFGMYFGDIQTVGYNMTGHIAVISMAFVTWAVFKQFDRIYGPREGTQEGLRMPDRSSRCDEMTEELRMEKIKELKN